MWQFDYCWFNLHSCWWKSHDCRLKKVKHCFSFFKHPMLGWLKLKFCRSRVYAYACCCDFQCLVGQTLLPGYLTVDNSPSDDLWWLWRLVMFHSYVKIPVAWSFLVKLQVNRRFKSQELCFLTKMYDPSIDISHLLNFPNYQSSLTSYHHFP